MMSEASCSVTAVLRRATSRPSRAGTPGVELGEGRGARSRGSVQHDDLLEGFESGHVGQQRHQVGTEQVGHGEQQARPRGAQDVSRLLAPIAGVERHQHGSDRVDGEARDHPGGAVGCPDGHAVAGLDPAPHERAGHEVDAFGQVPEGEPDRPVDNSLVVAEANHRLIQRLGNRPRRPITR